MAPEAIMRSKSWDCILLLPVGRMLEAGMDRLMAKRSRTMERTSQKEAEEGVETMRSLEEARKVWIRDTMRR